MPLIGLRRLFAAVPLAMTVLPVIRTGRGWVRVWDFPRLQIAALAALAHAAVHPNGRRNRLDRLLQIGLSAAVVFQGYKIYPYTPLHRTQVLRSRNVPTERCIRLLASNVLMDNRDYARTIDIIRESDPDIVCLLETDESWEQAMREIEKDYPYTTKCPIANTYGMLLYSRLPLVSSETRFLVEADIPSMRSVVRLRSGHEIILYCLHPRPPLPNHPSYGRDAELVMVGREIFEHKKPAIVMGDLNDVAWSYTTKLFQRVSHTLDPRVGRGLYNTFDATKPLLRYPLDHVFHTREFTLVDLHRTRASGSDHFPIVAELAYTPAAAPVQEPPRMTETDHEEAHDVLNDALKNGVTDPGTELANNGGPSI